MVGGVLEPYCGYRHSPLWGCDTFSWIVTDRWVLPGCHQNCDTEAETQERASHCIYTHHGSLRHCFNEINGIPLVCSSSKPDAGCQSGWGAGLGHRTAHIWPSVLGWGVGGIPMTILRGKDLCHIQSHHPALFHANPSSPPPGSLYPWIMDLAHQLPSPPPPLPGAIVPNVPVIHAIWESTRQTSPQESAFELTRSSSWWPLFSRWELPNPLGTALLCASRIIMLYQTFSLRFAKPQPRGSPFQCQVYFPLFQVLRRTWTPLLHGEKKKELDSPFTCALQGL